MTQQQIIKLLDLPERTLEIGKNQEIDYILCLKI